MKSGFSGISHTINDLEQPNRNPNPKYDLVRHNSKHGKGLSKEYVHYGLSNGGNSGFQAVNLAYQMGANTILLLGFDMFGTHYFGAHPDQLLVGSPFPDFIKSFESITEDVEIINCSRQTALNCFPRMSINKVLN